MNTEVLDIQEISSIQVIEVQDETSEFQEIQEINALEKDIAKLLNKSLDKAIGDGSTDPKKIYFFTKVNLKMKIFMIKRKINKKMEQLKVKKIISLSNDSVLSTLNGEQAKKVNSIFNSFLSEKTYAIFKMKEKLSKQAIRVFSENKKVLDFLSLLEGISKINDSNLFLVKKWTFNFMVVTYLNKNRSNQEIISLFLENGGKNIDTFIFDKLNPQNFKAEIQILKEIGFTLKMIEGQINYVPSPLAFTLAGYFTNWQKWNDVFLMESIKIMLVEKNPLITMDSTDAKDTTSNKEAVFSDEQKYQLIFDRKRYLKSRLK